MAQDLLVVGGEVLAPEPQPPGTAVLVRGGRVAALGPAGELEGAGVPVLDATGLRVVPGFLDTHVHGGREADTMHASVEALGAIALHLAAHGVTSWTPTAFACPPEALDRVLAAATTARDRQAAGTLPGARILGVHWESAFISPTYQGAQPPEHLVAPAAGEAHREVLRRRASALSIVTVAPELPGALDLIRELRAGGVTVALGHCDARTEDVSAGREAGATRVTHLCNAMRPFHHRDPGTVGAALVADDLYVEVIADGVHVHPIGLEIARRCKGADRLMLVSDALVGAGLPPGTHQLEGRTLHLAEVARLPDGTIAGSVITLERAVGLAVRQAGFPVAEAVTMATATPAASLGLVDRGRLAPGLLADLVLLDDAFDCRATVIGGRVVFDCRS